MIGNVSTQDRWHELDDDALIDAAATYTHGPIPQTPPLGLVVQMMRRLEEVATELERLNPAAPRETAAVARLRAFLADLPPRLWRWTQERTDIEVPPTPGWALIDANGFPVIQSEGGYGWLELGVDRRGPDSTVGRFLAEVPDLLERVLTDRYGPEDAHESPP